MAHLHADGENDPTLALVVGRRSFCSSMHPTLCPRRQQLPGDWWIKWDVVDVFLINA
jgi:hypothetical protein